MLGERLVAHLNQAKAKNPAIGDVRALGAMVACDFVNPATGAPDADKAKQVQQAALQKGLLLLTCGVYGNVVRFLFPLTIEDAVFAEGLDILAHALA